MKRHCSLIFPQGLFDRLHAHLFPGDGDEHAAVMLAGLVEIEGKCRLLVRELYLAVDGTDHVDGNYGYKMMRAEFIRPLVRRARIERLVYIGVHNHGGRDRVDFSQDDLDSHDRGHPALLDLAEGMPVGAVVMAKNAVAGDIWFPDGNRCELEETRILGANIRRLYAAPPSDRQVAVHAFNRQVQMFGEGGQALLSRAKIAVIGAGGVGSLLVEYLARLGIGSLIVIDPDTIDVTNLSRVVGATMADAVGPAWPIPGFLKRLLFTVPRRKVDIAKRVAKQANPGIAFQAIAGDFSRDDVARQVLDCDFIFLAADSMRARLVFNAIVQQYFIPGIQIGSLVTPDKDNGSLDAVFTVTRWVLPGVGCLWCSDTIDRHQLAIEAKSNDEHRDQDYGSGAVNPSVITLNAVGASMAVNDFLFSYLGLFTPSVVASPRRVHHLDRRVVEQVLVPNHECTECSQSSSSRFGRGIGVALPTSS